MMKVSKYYPHEKPTVICVDSEFRSGPVGADGEVHHPYLQEYWTAMGSLKAVVQLLSTMRSSNMFQKGQLGPSAGNSLKPTVSPPLSKYRVDGERIGNAGLFNSPVSTLATSYAMEDA
jgi:hypothetical protein